MSKRREDWLFLVSFRYGPKAKAPKELGAFAFEVGLDSAGALGLEIQTAFGRDEIGSAVITRQG